MDFVNVDGAIGEGGGQILRTSVTLSAIFGKPVRITNIRAKRSEPGIRPQHLQAILSAGEMCNAELRGARVGSTFLEFSPGEMPSEFDRVIDTGTAGSITLIAQTLIPISIFRSVDLRIEIAGGTEVPNSPTIDYLMHIVAPIYRMIGAELTIDLKRRGYYPKGGGRIKVVCKLAKKLEGGIILEPGQTQEVKIISASRSLPEHVARRQAESAATSLMKLGYSGKISTPELDSLGESLSPGSSILVYSNSSGSFMGFSSLGERGKRAEMVGDEAARAFINESRCKPTVDLHLADMLSTLLPCLPGESEFTTSELSGHLMTNMKVCEAIVKDVKFQISNRAIKSKDECFKIKVGGSRSDIRKV